MWAALACGQVAAAGLNRVYDATNEFVRIGEIFSYRIGPHEIILMPDGYTICIANGGILTHPDTGLAKLNLAEMQSSIILLDSRHGDCIARFDVPKRIQRLSVRHMAVDHNGTVWLRGQYQGSNTDQAPLIATASQEYGLEFPEIEPVQKLGLANYLGSVASNLNGGKIAFSSPKGNSIVTIDVDKKIVSEKRRINAGCGISATQSGFLTTSHSGQVNQHNKNVYWDNHIIKL